MKQKISNAFGNVISAVAKYHLTAVLCALLLLKAGRARAQDDDYLGYRRGYYREDGNRMNIDTQTIGWELDLSKLGLNTGDSLHIGVVGNFVDDAISGATPTGAPPQSQWHFASFQDYYTSQVNSQFNQALTNPNYSTDYIDLFIAGYFGPTNLSSSYQAYTNYVAGDALPQIQRNATNSANQQVSTITSSPNYHNTKVPLVSLEDHRRSYSVGIPVTYGLSTLTPEFADSREHDYHSRGVALNYTILLNKKNTTLNLGWSHDVDRVLDDNFVWEGKVSDDFLIGLNQLIDPKSYLTADLTYGQEYGYLSDPYRGVIWDMDSSPGANLDGHQTNPDDAALTAEVRPRRRTKEVFFLGYTRFFDAANGSLDAGYRLFHDSFGIWAHTAELSWHQKLGRYIAISPDLRYYWQTAARFYTIALADLNPAVRPEYYSSDYRLSEMNTWTVGASINIRVHKHFTVDLTYMKYFMQGLDGATSQSAYPSANVYSIGGRILF